MTTQTVSIPKSAKTWVYQASRNLTQDEIELIDKAYNSFFASWESHGKALKGYGFVEHNRFLVIVVDESFANASGCSIDKSVAFVQKIEEELNIQLLDKTKVAFLDSDENIQVVAFNEVKQAIEQGHIKKDTTIFNNTITSWEEKETIWKQAAGESWVKRFFK